MIEFSEVSLGEIAVHKAGNKSKDENLVCSKTFPPLLVFDSAQQS